MKTFTHRITCCPEVNPRGWTPATVLRAAYREGGAAGSRQAMEEKNMLRRVRV